MCLISFQLLLGQTSIQCIWRPGRFSSLLFGCSRAVFMLWHHSQSSWLWCFSTENSTVTTWSMFFTRNFLGPHSFLGFVHKISWLSCACASLMQSPANDRAYLKCSRILEKKGGFCVHSSSQKVALLTPDIGAQCTVFNSRTPAKRLLMKNMTWVTGTWMIIITGGRMERDGKEEKSRVRRTEKNKKIYWPTQ